MKILIVDDEKLARERLAGLLRELDGEHELSEADNGLEAVQAVARAAPELVLLDIRMPVMDGLEAASHLSKLPAPPAIIFTTAYQEHALAAFDAHAVDYLLKPIRRERLAQALSRARIIHKAQLQKLRNQVPDRAPRSHLSARAYGKLELIPIIEVRYLKAEQKYVSVGRPGRVSLVDDSLKSMEAEFHERFLRIHRNALIALDYIESLQRDRSGQHRIGLRDIAEKLLVSRRHLSEVRRSIKDLGA